MVMRVLEVDPIPRTFSFEKALEFCIEYTGFKVDWGHRSDDNAPLSKDSRPISSSTTTTSRLMSQSRSSREGVCELHAGLAAKHCGCWRAGTNNDLLGHRFS